ncbi:MAG: HTTM domain-containing protein, partial [Bacteroidota bacterium]
MAWVWDNLHRPRSIAPLAVFRMLYGFMMLWSMLRFIAKGWVQSLYVDPLYYFPFRGLEWIQPLGATGMHLVFGLLVIASGAILVGWHYRIFAWVFALGFT